MCFLIILFAFVFCEFHFVPALRAYGGGYQSLPISRVSFKTEKNSCLDVAQLNYISITKDVLRPRTRLEFEA